MDKKQLLKYDSRHTFVNRNTDVWVAFKLRKKNRVYWVYARLDNKWEYIGHIYNHNGPVFKPGNGYTKEDGVIKHFQWIMSNVDKPTFDDCVETLEHIECSECGQWMWVPESIRRGIGPVCAERLS